MALTRAARAALRIYIEQRSIPIPEGRGCWLWLRSYGSHGYGAVSWSVVEPGRRSMTTAPRVSFLAFNGELADDEEPRHTCHQKWCVNPDHLIPGTHLENIEDTRLVHGHAKKLAPQDVIEIRQLAGSVSRRELARRFGVSRETISQVLSGETWTHLRQPR